MSDSGDAKPVKLPYFHRELSVDDKALIGDITPKPLDPSATQARDNAPTSDNKISAGSAWNSANTWEEREVTPWAMRQINSLFSNSVDLPSNPRFQGRITSVSNVEGHAEIAHIRGKPRYIYELSYNLIFEIDDSQNQKQYDGKFVVTEVGSDQLDDIEIAITWTKGPASADLMAVKDWLVKNKAAMTAIKNKMLEFETEMRKI